MPMRTTSTSVCVDRISELPDSILVHILSLLPLEDAIPTEVLSKRWKSLWTHSPSLLFRQYRYSSCDVEDEGFCYDHDPEEWKYYAFVEMDFVSFVDKTLSLSNCSKVEKLEFDLENKPCLASSVDSWAAFAAARGTEELLLRFHDDGYYRITNRNDYYELPQHLFTNSLFRELHFCNCRVNPKGNVDWKSLKKLSIGDVKLSNELLQKILLGSPVLEMLELYWYNGFSRLDIDNASLKKLILRKYVGPTYENLWFLQPFGDNEEDEDEDEADGAHGAEEGAADGNNAFEENLAVGENPNEEDEAGDGHGFEEDEDGGEQDPGLVISAPHLESLEICGCLAKNCQLINVSSLVDAKLCCNWRWERSGDGQDIRVQNELRGLLTSFVHVKSLTVGTWAMQVLSSMEAKGLSLPLLNCTSLTLEACLRDEAFPWIATMFGLSPNLETLVMTKSSSGSTWGCWKNELDSHNAEHNWTSQKRIFKCLSLHLKEVVFADLSWFHYESNFFSFVQFLLKNAKVLQKVMIKMSMLGDALPKEFFVAANKLLTFPRSSPDAVVMFCK